MGVFLGFDDADTLARVQEMGSGPFGSCDASAMVPAGRRVLELHPQILEQTRPKVFHALVGHARYTTNGLRVDQADVIQMRRAVTVRDRAIDELLMTLRQLVVEERAVRMLDDLATEAHHGGVAQLRANVGNLRIRAHEALAPKPLPSPLDELAGTTVRL